MRNGARRNENPILLKLARIDSVQISGRIQLWAWEHPGVGQVSIPDRSGGDRSNYLLNWEFAIGRPSAHLRGGEANERELPVGPMPKF